MPPGSLKFAEELEGMAFKGNLGEFCFSTPNGEGFVDKDELFMDTLQTVLQQKDVKRVMVIPDEAHYDEVRSILRKMDDDELAATSVRRFLVIRSWRPWVLKEKK